MEHPITMTLLSFPREQIVLAGNYWDNDGAVRSEWKAVILLYSMQGWWCGT